MRAAVVLIAAAGCNAVFGLDPARSSDGGVAIDAAAIDAPMRDGAPGDGGAPDASRCPPAPTGCTSFECADSASCYYVCNPLPWSPAQAFCQTAGIGCLVTIDNAGENFCINQKTMPFQTDQVWFGWYQLAGSAEPGTGWVWICGGSSFVHPFWGANGQPDNAGFEDCGMMSAGGDWNDGACSTSFRYVCELP